MRGDVMMKMMTRVKQTTRRRIPETETHGSLLLIGPTRRHTQIKISAVCSKLCKIKQNEFLGFFFFYQMWCFFPHLRVKRKCLHSKNTVMITRPFNDQMVAELDPHVLVGFNLGRIHNANKFMKEQLVFVSVCTWLILIVGANTVHTNH